MQQPVRTDPPSITWVILMQEFVYNQQQYFYFHYHQRTAHSKIFQDIAFTLLRLPLK